MGDTKALMGKTKRRKRGQKASPAKVERANLVKEAVELRMSGLEYREIGLRQGCAEKTAWQRVQDGMKATLELTKPAADQLRAEHNHRLGRCLEALLPEAYRGDVQAIDRVVKVSERLARLNGLDAPTRSEVTGAEGGPLDIRAVASEFKAKLMALSDAELEAEAKRLGVAE